MEKVEEILLTIVKSMVDNPADVKIISTELATDERGEFTKINVGVHKNDAGRCIGIEGKNAEAIRKVVALVAFKQIGKRVRAGIESTKKPYNYEE